MEMLKSFLSGIAVLFIISVICLILGDWSYLYKISGILAAVSLFTTGILSGAFNTSMGTRPLHQGQFKYQDQKERDNRVKWSTRVLLFGIPHIIATGIYVYVVFLD